jgi:hypothetical protein
LIGSLIINHNVTVIFIIGPAALPQKEDVLNKAIRPQVGQVALYTKQTTIMHRFRFRRHRLETISRTSHSLITTTLELDKYHHNSEPTSTSEFVSNVPMYFAAILIIPDRRLLQFASDLPLFSTRHYRQALANLILAGAWFNNKYIKLQPT